MARFHDADSSANLPDLLEAWREAERATDSAQAALASAKRAAVAAKVAADAVAEMAHVAELTLQAAEHARDVSLRAALEAGAAVDLANHEVVTSETTAADAAATFGVARDTYKAAQQRAFEREREKPQG